MPIARNMQRPRVFNGRCAKRALAFAVLIVSGTSRCDNRQRLKREFARDRVLVRVVIDGSNPVVESESWCEYWKPYRRCFGADRRLARRLSQLKKAWPALLQKPTCRRRQRDYCWRYFCLLHHTLRIAREETKHDDAIDALRRIVGFEAFTIEVRGQVGVAAGLATNRNPIYLLGRLPPKAPLTCQ
jgi:hypothetical protein